MATFDLLTPPYLAESVANPVVEYLKKKYGLNGLKIEQPFSTKVSWSPTIQINSSTTELLLVEVSESLYPTIFTTAYPDLLNEESERAIKVFQACPLASFQADKRQEQTRKLKKHGFGLITVDETLSVDEQFSAAVLIHHISDSKFEGMVKDLKPDVKRGITRAFEVYRTNASQGVQLAGQVVEALIHSIASQCHSKGLLSRYRERDRAADVIDSLYSSTDQKLKDQRACLGGARQFMKTGRNATSHPAKSKKQAKKKLNAREGFESAIRVCGELCQARKSLGLGKRLAI